MDEAEVLRAIAAIVGDDAVVTGDEELRYFGQDALRGRGNAQTESESPLAVVRPASGEETARVLAIASGAGVPVVAYGAGTGLMGGARTQRRGIVLDTVRLKDIEVRAEDRIVWAGAGCILADVDSALREHGLCLGHDPWTFPVATVGGTLSTNSLGYKGARYGGIGDQAIALEVALADGTLLRTRSVRRHSAGPDLTRIFIGAEGTLGVITAAALLGQPVSEREVQRAYQFETFEAGFAAIQQIAALRLQPSLLDYGEEHSSPWPDLSPREAEPPVLYLGFEGLVEEVDFSMRRAKAVVEANGGQKLPKSQAREFWERRHVVAQRFARGLQRPTRIGGDDVAFDYIHVALPPSKVLEFKDACHTTCAREGVGLVECGLWTAPDFFSAVFVLPDAGGGVERLTEVIDGLLRQAQDLGGSMEYVHGAGLRLAHLMEREHGDGLDVLRRLKAALDPAGILNPGKLGL